MKVRYLGPSVRVQIAVSGQWCERGGTVDVPARLGRELVKQASWEKATDMKEQNDG